MNNKTTNILFCGTGGQGVLTAAEVMGWAAIYAGFHAKKSEVHGMAQRGGSVESHVRFGPQVLSPLIPKGEVDVLVPFHAGEADRLRDFLRSGGVDLLPFLAKAYEKGATALFLNTFLLGVLAAHLEVPKGSWLMALERLFKNKKFEENIRVFHDGWREVRS